MKHYPSMPRFDDRPQDYLGQGWYKFGSRKQLIGADSWLNDAIEKIKATGDVIPTILGNPKFPFVAFFEYHGPGSFAGFHVEEEKQITLIDVSTYKRGIVFADEFVNLFDGKVNIPKIVYKGTITEQLVKDVKDGKIGSFEGVVMKGRSEKLPWMAKIKSKAWLDKARELHIREDML